MTIDITAEIDGEQVDAANDLSYQIGSGTMLTASTRLLTGLSAGEDATRETKLLRWRARRRAGSHQGQALGSNERELPAADDEFVQLASEFDTIDELKGRHQEAGCRS